MDQASTVIQYMRDKIGSAPSELIVDGKIHRFDAADKPGKRTCWYVAHPQDNGGRAADVLEPAAN